MTHLSIRLLGTYDVQLAGQPITNFRSVKNQALLAYLVSEAERPQRRAALAGLLWPDDPEAQALRNLRQALFRLRNVLDNDKVQPPFLEINTTTVQFNGKSDHSFDAATFTQLLAACAQHARTAGDQQQNDHRQQCAQCSERLAQAVGLYCGEFMHGMYVDESPALEEWLLLRREWFHHQALAALHDLAAWHEAQQNYARAYDYARRQIELDPLREEAHRQLMRALALDGKRSEALAQYEACYTILYQELGTAPTAETEQLIRQIEEGTLVAQSKAGGARPLPDRVESQVATGQLPTPATPFFGREEERAQLRTRLLNPAQRLITLLGQGGVGKTRLALAAAADLTGAFADGVWFVALEGVEQGEGLVAALAGALGFHFEPGSEPQQQLVAYLHHREALLLLDNFEQLVGATPVPGEGIIARLLEQAPRLKVLLTSRVRLNLQQEQVLAVNGLPVPPQLEDPGFTAVEHYSSVALFVERAQRSPLGFELTPENVTAVTAICRLVEGVPLGIELAAAWTDHYSCAEIAAAIDETLDFLQSSMVDLPPRQRSLRAVFDYSWRLLTPAEQQALTQMSLFRAGFSREAAQQVAQVTLPQLVALVNKSLVRAVAPGRYAMHELVRQFADEVAASQLADHEKDQVTARHAAYYLHLVHIQAGLFGEQPQKAVALLLQDMEHIRQAWRWAVTQERADQLLAALPNLARTLDLAGLYREAATTWEKALVHWRDTWTPAQSVPTKITPAKHFHLHLQIEAARTQTILGNYARARTYAEAALAQLPPAGERLPVTQAMAHQQLGVIYYRQGDHAAALPFLETAITLAQQSAETRLTADCLLSLGEVQLYQGDQAAQQSFTEALARYRYCGDRRGEGAALHSLGLFAHMHSDFEEGRRYFTEALRIHRALEDRHLEAMTLMGLAGFYSTQGTYTESDRYAQQTRQLSRVIGYRIGEVQALTSLGVNQMYQGFATAARAYFEEALLIAQASGYRRGEGALLNNLGNLANDDGDYAQAETHYRAALAAARKSGDRYYTCARLHNLGNTLRFQGEYVRAQAYYQDAATMAAAIGDRWIEGSAHADLALSCDFLCDPAAAKDHAERARALAHAIGDQWCAVKALAARGWMAVKEGDEGGLLLIAQAIALAQAHNERGIEGAAEARHGFALLHLDRTAAAVTAFERSVALRRQVNDRVQICTSLAGLAAALWATGEQERAHAEVRQILDAIGERPVGVADDPLRVYGICAQILAAVGDPQATALQQRAWHHMMEQAAALSSAQQRARFLYYCAEQLGPQTFNF